MIGTDHNPGMMGTLGCQVMHVVQFRDLGVGEKPYHVVLVAKVRFQSERGCIGVPTFEVRS
jgi:hypothetical protein